MYREGSGIQLRGKFSPRYGRGDRYSNAGERRIRSDRSRASFVAEIIDPDLAGAFCLARCRDVTLAFLILKRYREFPGRKLAFWPRSAYA